MTAASRDFQVLAKPAGAVCNMDCRYCYYLEKQRLYPDGAPLRMREPLLEQYIVQQIDAAPEPTINFCWHGGEPTILGLDYFRTIVELQRKHRPGGRRIVNGLQTNGVLLDEEWCRFLAAERFGVGLSIDGPAELHNRYRVNRGGGRTHREAVRAFKLLRRHRVNCNLLCVVHDGNVRYPMQVYRFLRDIGGTYIGFLPMVARDEAGGVTPETVPADALGEFLCDVFDEWVRHDVGSVAVQIVDEATRPARGVDHSLCIFRETCGDIPVVERNGDFYCCDHFVDPAHRLGNIRETPLVALLESAQQRAFGDAKRDSLPRCCRACEVRSMCNGGCPKDRFIQAPDGEGGLNYLCAGYKRFFTHVLPYASKLASARLAPAGAAASRPAAPPAERFPAAGRNDPCPCGSGQKYKKCCLTMPQSRAPDAT